MHLRPLRSLVLSLFLTWIVNVAESVTGAEIAPTDSHAEQGLRAFQRGDFERAVLSWTEASQSYESERKLSLQSNALIQLAQAFQALGQYNEARTNLELAVALAEKAGDRTQMAFGLGTLGNLYIATGPGDVAQKYLTEGLRLARESGNLALAAVILNNLGNLRTSQENYKEAMAAYMESESLAMAGNNPALAASALTNAATASTRNGQYSQAKTLLDRASQQVRIVGPSHDQALGLINIGLAYHRLRAQLPDSKDALLLQAFEAFSEAGRSRRKYRRSPNSILRLGSPGQTIRR